MLKKFEFKKKFETLKKKEEAETFIPFFITCFYHTEGKKKQAVDQIFPLKKKRNKGKKSSRTTIVIIA